MEFVRRCYGLRGIYGRFDSKIRFEIESDGSKYNMRVQARDLHTGATVHPWVKVHLVSKFSTL